MTHWSFILVAGGSSSRFGGRGKQIELLGKFPVWVWSLMIASSLSDHGLSEIVVVIPENMAVEFLKPDMPAGINFKLVNGGKQRRDSVLSGLQSVENEWSLIHDAARPFVSRALCLRVMESAIQNGSAIPLIPVSDALKMMDNEENMVSKDRKKLFLTQTPQAFPTKKITEVLLNSSESVSDEAEAWLESGRSPAHVKGEIMNFKITFPEDLNMARMLVAGTSETRTGFGYDIHPLSPGRPLVLGGVRIPFALGLYGHSDGDLICHAVSDALLGAADLPDIGTLFPSCDPQFEDAFSLGLLKKISDLIREKGFLTSTVDVVINAQAPKLEPWIGKIEDSLKKVLFRGRAGTLRVKAKSGENLGEIGHGEAMACWAVVTIITAPVFSPEKWITNNRWNI